MSGTQGVLAMIQELMKSIEQWEAEGGALAEDAPVLRGKPEQAEWAARIRVRVNADFDRVASAFQLVASKQSAGKRARTDAILAILEDKRAEVMSRDDAGYFIRVWQEIHDQVRQMICGDPRYLALKP